ncbi:class I SAM-dependent methyltransferase [Williamwhitmania taraxaci]|uniref:Methyltransferase domain-containing protein n=1 Tax=Williamwhitmania taraxaci TaxID=1640674 RepID=A0A1G6H9E1_9BACT|nr:class I SAM-dependent methyltransferase [Williamwhitmania taraxaci]SDB90907.1 Methyltransferase domain-containing protein [Williamwhitmania taraxaci]
MVALREWLFRIWYWYVSNVDKKGEVLFMNYGYSNPEMPVSLNAEDIPNKYSAQLYHLIGSATDLKGKDIVEVGCGRGGGLSYIVNTFSPATALGVDLNKRAAKFCSKHHNKQGLSFAQGDAQDLSFIADGSFDAIINVESSHRYPRMDLFLKEVHRVLRPGGYFLYTDFRYDHEMTELKQQLAATGMVIHKEIMITDNVVQALEADDQRKRVLVKKLAPRLIHKVALNFAGTIGSKTYNQFATHKYEYYHFVMQKN